MFLKHLILTFVLLLLSKFGIGQDWTQLADFPDTERDDGVAFVINDKAYCGSGLKTGWILGGDFHVLDLATETWSTIASLPVGKERQYACGFTDGLNGFVFGGEAGGIDLNDLWMYSPLVNGWEAKASKPGNGVRGASCFVIHDTAYIVGGATGTTDAISEVWAYSISADTWIQKNNLPISNWRGSGAEANGKGYLLYGMNSSYSYNRNLYEYDPSADSWTYKSTFSGPGTGKVYANMQSIKNDLIVFAGKDSLNACNNELWKYDLTANSWLSVSTLTATLRKGGMGFINSGIYYYTCGISQADIRLKETWKTVLSVGINEKENKKQLTIFPNPASDHINVKSSEFIFQSKNYKIINMWGKVVLTGSLNENDQIGIQSLSQGVYQLVIGSYSSRIIVQ